jgi:hypothetical protein
VQASGLSAGTSLCPSRVLGFISWYPRLDCWDTAQLHMPMLHLCYSFGGSCLGVDQSSSACNEVVYFSNTLLS